MYIKVLVDNSGKSMNKTFTYIINSSLTSNLSFGSRLLVPFGKNDSLTVGFFVGFDDDPGEYNFKEVLAVMDGSSLLNDEQKYLFDVMSSKYFCDYIDIIHTIIPKELRRVEGKIRITSQEETIPTWMESRVVEIDFSPNSKGVNNNKLYKLLRESITNSQITIRFVETKRDFFRYKKVYSLKRKALDGELRSDKQSKIYDFLLEVGSCEEKDVLKLDGITKATLRGFTNKSFVSVTHVKDIRGTLVGKAIKDYTLSKEQEDIRQKINNTFNTYKRHMIFGVTGSGKTEIYINLIQDCLGMGMAAIYLVPEISLTAQLIERLTSAFGQSIGVIHSKLSEGERHDTLRQARSGDIKIIIGARSAVFADVTKLGLIIVDEFHDGSYKSEMSPKYNALDIAFLRGEFNNCPVVMGSATPDVPLYYKALTGEIILHRLEKRYLSSLPKVRLLDSTSLKASEIVSPTSISLIKANIEYGYQSLVFVNKRGYAGSVTCGDCGYAYKCNDCDITLCYHHDLNNLRCHYCGKIYKFTAKCNSCGSSHLKGNSFGTEKIELFLKKHLPSASIVRVDLDTTKAKNSFASIVTSIDKNSVDVIVGTQMISKGLDFERLKTVIVIDGDRSLYFPDYRSSERTFQLLAQVGGRAGRRQVMGEMIIESKTVNNFVFDSLYTFDFVGFYLQEIKLRKLYKYPPFSSIGQILIEDNDEQTALSNATIVRELIFNNLSRNDIEVYGPNPALLSKMKGYYRFQILVKSSDLIALEKLFRLIYNETKKTRFRVAFDINPYNIF